MGWFSELKSGAEKVVSLAPFGIGSSYWAGKNLEGQYANLAYQKEIQQQIFQREDTAMQRRVADLTAAGLSPVLAAGGSGAGAGAVVNTTAPQRDPHAQPDPLTVMSLLKMKTDIAATEAQKIKTQADTVRSNLASAGIAWDLGLAKKFQARYQGGSVVGKVTQDIGSTLRDAATAVSEKISPTTTKASRMDFKEYMQDIWLESNRSPKSIPPAKLREFEDRMYKQYRRLGGKGGR